MLADHSSALSEGLRQGLHMQERSQDAIKGMTTAPSLAPAEPVRNFVFEA